MYSIISGVIFYYDIIYIIAVENILLIIKEIYFNFEYSIHINKRVLIIFLDQDLWHLYMIHYY